MLRPKPVEARKYLEKKDLDSSVGSFLLGARAKLACTKGSIDMDYRRGHCN
jgi:hypothetical protein